MLATVLSLSLLAAVNAAPTKRWYELEPNPSGGVFDNKPSYKYASDFDMAAFNLALNVEHAEYDLFGYGLAKFSVADFEAEGYTADDRLLIEFFQQQEIGHQMVIAGLLDRRDLSMALCEYAWPNFTSVLEFVNFNQMITRAGESGVLGFIPHLNSAASGAVFGQTIATEARQQFAFKQLAGEWPMDVWFEPAITGSMAWTLLAPYVVSCPAGSIPVKFNNFPALNVTNNPGPGGVSNVVATTYVPTAPGRTVDLTWEKPGMSVGPNNTYLTRSDAGVPKYLAWISQLGLVYTDVTVHSDGVSGSTVQPSGELFFNGDKYAGDPLVNGTMFVVLTDANPFVTPFNLSLIEPHIVAGPMEYQSG